MLSIDALLFVEVAKIVFFLFDAGNEKKDEKIPPTMTGFFVCRDVARNVSFFVFWETLRATSLHIII